MSYIIDDRWKDIQIKKRVECKIIFLDYSYTDIKLKNQRFTTDTLLNVVYIIEKF